MIITITYGVDADLYRADTKHDVSLTTTEYVYRNEMLVHLQVGKNFGIRLNDRLKQEFKRAPALPGEQFLFKKTYNRDAAKPITQSSFTEKLNSFDMSQTEIKREILEEYRYTGKDSAAYNVQIVITEKDGVMAAVIDFSDTKQYENFIAPTWLTKN